MRRCTEHSLSLDVFCFEACCTGPRLICDSCAKQKHHNHSCVILEKNNAGLNHLKMNSNYSNSRQVYFHLNNLRVQAQNKLNYIDALANGLKKWKKQAESQIVDTLQTISITFTDQEFQRCSTLLRVAQQGVPDLQKQAQLEGVARILRRLSETEVTKVQELIQSSQIVTSNLSEQLQKLNETIQSLKSLTENRNIFLKENLAKKINEYKPRKRNVKVFEKSKLVKPMNEESSSSSDSEQEQNKQNKGAQKNKKQRKNQKKEQKKEMNENNQKKKEQAPKKRMRKEGANRSIFEADEGQKIDKQALLDYLKVCPETLQQIIISGKNQFDEQCLQLVSRKFKDIRKILYLYDFDNCSYKIQMDKTFFNKTRDFSQNLIPSSKQVFSMYAKLQKLENMCISQIDEFDKNWIKNERIKFLTVGKYQNERFQRIHVDLVKEIENKFTGLVNLNLFSISPLPQYLIRNVLRRNPELKQLWLSQCRFDFGTGLQEIGNSRLVTLILDGTNIKSNIMLPPTIQHLIIDNCSCQYIKNFDKATRLSHFSIHHTDLEEPITNRQIEHLSKICGSNLEYLNLGYQRVTEKCLEHLVKFENLKHLSIQGTGICQTSLCLAFEKKLSKIQSLNIINTPKGGSTIVKQLAQNFKKLKILCINYRQRFQSKYFQNFKKIQSLILKQTQENRSVEYTRMFKKFITQLYMKKPQIQIKCV